MTRADELVKAAKGFAKYHEEQAGYGGVSWEFHARATTHILTCAEYARELENQLAVKEQQLVELEGRIQRALAMANGRWEEWGERALSVAAILEGEE